MSRGRSGPGLDVSRLVELDMAFLGPRVIVAEFVVGVVGPLMLALLSFAYAVRVRSPLLSWPVIMGIELAAIGVNYVPLLVEAFRRRRDAARIAETKQAIQEGRAEARSYGLRQAWILVPGAVIAFALLRTRVADGVASIESVP
jgi:hypothetical protein